MKKYQIFFNQFMEKKFLKNKNKFLKKNTITTLMNSNKIDESLDGLLGLNSDIKKIQNKEKQKKFFKTSLGKKILNKKRNK